MSQAYVHKFAGDFATPTPKGNFTLSGSVLEYGSRHANMNQEPLAGDNNVSVLVDKINALENALAISSHRLERQRQQHAKLMYELNDMKVGRRAPTASIEDMNENFFNINSLY
jgi:hypothetical protein